MTNSLFIWFVLLVAFYLAYTLGARVTAARLAAVEGKAPPAVPRERLAALETRLAPMLAITGSKGLGDVFQFEGKLRGKVEEMFGKIREAFTGDPLTPMLLEGEGNEVRVLLLPGRKEAAAEQPKWWLHGLLFLATLATTTWAGALHAGVNL